MESLSVQSLNPYPLFVGVAVPVKSQLSCVWRVNLHKATLKIRVDSPDSR